jgi:hypothetical protein
MLLELPRHEVRVVGPWLLALPLFVACLFVVAVAMMGLKGASQVDISNMTMAGIEGGVPLVAGIGAAWITSQDSALELQLSLPMPYRRTVRRRMALFLIWSALIEVSAVIAAAGLWPWILPQGSKGSPAEYLFAWLVPLLWFTAWGAGLALALRSRVASVALLGVVWAVELLFHGTLAAYSWTRAVFVFATMFDAGKSFWGSNRAELLVTAVVLFVAIWCYLGNSEWCWLRGEDR